MNKVFHLQATSHHGISFTSYRKAIYPLLRKHVGLMSRFHTWIARQNLLREKVQSLTVFENRVAFSFELSFLGDQGTSEPDPTFVAYRIVTVKLNKKEKKNVKLDLSS